MTHATRGGLVRAAVALLVVALLGACSTPVPNRQKDLCAVFDQFPEWYDHALASRKRWGTPIPIQMSIIHHESGYRSHVRPPMQWFLGIIPLGRPSTAKGYAQAISPAWKDYTSERGGTFRSRSDMEDALDFVGWYNYKSWKGLGIPRTDARRLYLAYHEGRGGYARGSWKKKPAVRATADRVAATADRYAAQLKRCESRFRCDSWYQFWPFCS